MKGVFVAPRILANGQNKDYCLNRPKFRIIFCQLFRERYRNIDQYSFIGMGVYDALP